MKALLIPILLALVVLVAVGCSDPADASGPDTIEVTSTDSITFVALQDSLASTIKRIAYVLAEEDDTEVVAYRYVVEPAVREWRRVFPNPGNAFCDSVAVCPSGYVIPIEGEFDALTIKGQNTGGRVQVHVYRP